MKINRSWSRNTSSGTPMTTTATTFRAAPRVSGSILIWPIILRPYRELALRKSVPVSELRFGMYIAELDRPWTETPFRFQGFVLSSERELETLQKYCKSVFVD